MKRLGKWVLRGFVMWMVRAFVTTLANLIYPRYWQNATGQGGTKP